MNAHVPNHIPLGKRLIAVGGIVLSSIVLYHYVATGVATLSAGRNGPSITVSGLWALPAIAMFGGMLSISLAVVIDHYDQRPNERLYRVWMIISFVAMVLGKISAIVVISYLRRQNA